MKITGLLLCIWRNVIHTVWPSFYDFYNFLGVLWKRYIMFDGFAWGVFCGHGEVSFVYVVSFQSQKIRTLSGSSSYIVVIQKKSQLQKSLKSLKNTRHINNSAYIWILTLCREVQGSQLQTSANLNKLRLKNLKYSSTQNLQKSKVGQNNALIRATVM